MAKKKQLVKVPTLSELTRKFEGLSFASDTHDENIPWLPSRMLAFNYLLGGGIPFGKIMEIFGEESSGKSLMAYDFAYCTQYLGGIVLWVDAEQSFTNSWAEVNGLDLTRVMVYKETVIEKISDWIAQASLYWRSKLTHNEPILVVLDSMAALDTEININSEMSNSSADMGNRAKAIYKMFRVRNEFLYSLGVTQIYINQLRKNLKAGMFENPDTTPGGLALKFYASLRIGFYGGKMITVKAHGKDRKIGRVTSIRCLKNKVGPPRETIKASPMYNNPKYHDVGFDRYHNLSDVLVDNDIIDRNAGGTYRYKDNVIARGEEKFQKVIEKDDKLRRILLRKCGINTVSTTKKKLESLTTNLFPIGEIDYETQSTDSDEEDE
jgi:recombination protein RecA